MKIKDLLAARDSVSSLYSAKMSGGVALKVRKAVRIMEGHLSDYDNALKDWIEKNNLEGVKFSDLNESQMKFFSDMQEAEVDDTWDAPLDVESLESAEISALDIDRLVNAGLVSEKEEGRADEP